jgi:folate-binding protein YgfZ
MPGDSLEAVFVVGADDLSLTEAEAVLAGAAVAPADLVHLDVAGPAVLQCIQGIHTNDVERAGPAGFVYGATLTPKGMVISDLWVARHNGDCTLYAPAEGKEAVLGVFARHVPPRLARITDRSDTIAVLELVGPEARDVVGRAGIEMPPPGRSTAATPGGVRYRAAAPSHGHPFQLLLSCPREEADALLHLLESNGATVARGGALELARIVAGWPRLGAEIGEKTLPQEIRFDEIDAVSHSKGCYTGQETVARLHFRGHANWKLVGLRWAAPPSFETAAVLTDDKAVGRVTSAAWLPGHQCFIGLAMVRHDVAPDRAVLAGGSAARTVPLPFAEL